MSVCSTSKTHVGQRCLSAAHLKSMSGRGVSLQHMQNACQAEMSVCSTSKTRVRQKCLFAAHQNACQTVCGLQQAGRGVGRKRVFAD